MSFRQAEPLFGDRWSALEIFCSALSILPGAIRLVSTPFLRHLERRMKYLCLVYSSEHDLHNAPDSPRDEECFAYAESVAASGRMLAAEALQPVQSATTVRMRGGQLSITDGPFAETKEQLAGFYLVEARDLNEAIQLAGHIPAARVGCVEVRPVRELQL
jgi:hypothetical protein